MSLLYNFQPSENQKEMLAHALTYIGGTIYAQRPNFQPKACRYSLIYINLRFLVMIVIYNLLWPLVTSFSAFCGYSRQNIQIFL